MFYRDSDNIYRVTELDALPWLVHGFGTRLADIPALFAQARHPETDPLVYVRGRRRAAPACWAKAMRCSRTRPAAWSP